MRAALRAMLAVACVTLVAQRLAAAPADAAALARAEGYIRSLTSVRAHFTQDLIAADGKTLEHSEGVMSLARPGHFRWDYQKPASLIVSDGTTLWLYDPELEQVTVRRVGDTLSQTPAMLLSGQASVRDGFTAKDGGTAEGLAWVVLTPRQATSDFSELKLAFAGQDLRRMEFRSKLNQTTRIEFQSVERNAHLDASIFSFVPPPGVDVIGAPAGPVRP